MHSIIKQSFACTERYVPGELPPSINGDGFGIGWFPIHELEAESLESQNAKASVTVEPFTFNEQSFFISDVSRKRKFSDAQPRSPSRSSLAFSTRKRHKSQEMDNTQSKTMEEDNSSNLSYNSCASSDSYAPGVFTSVTPAWNNRNLKFLSEKVQSSLVFAHVRAASMNSMTTEVNCHPFSYKRFLWMHNGGIPNFELIKRSLLSRLRDETFNIINGTTDSEACFALFLEQLLVNSSNHKMETNGGKKVVKTLDCIFSWEEMRVAMENVISIVNQLSINAGINEPSLLNFAITDGKSVVASKYVNHKTASAASMYFSSGTKWADDPKHQGKGLYKMHQSDRREHVVIIASERLSKTEEDWVEVPKNHFIVVTPAVNILLIPVKTEPIS